MGCGLGELSTPSQPWIHGFTLHGQHPEDTLVHLAKRLLVHEPLQGFDAEGKLAKGHASLGAKAPIAEPLQVLGRCVVTLMFLMC